MVCVAIIDELKLLHFFFGNGRQVHLIIFSISNLFVDRKVRRKWKEDESDWK